MLKKFGFTRTTWWVIFAVTVLIVTIELGKHSY